MVTSLSLAVSRKPWIFKSFFVQYAQPVLLALQCSIFFFFPFSFYMLVLIKVYEIELFRVSEKNENCI